MTRLNSEVAARRTTRPKARRTKAYIAFMACAVAAIATLITVFVTRPWETRSYSSVPSVRYLGVYQPDAPRSFSGVDQFAQGIGRQPNLVSYYSPWLEPFQVSFATSAAKHGAITLVQMDPSGISLESISSGRYDTYLRSYAATVKTFGKRIVLSFGHEMNGYWYSWANGTSPAVFVDAWRHVVTVFRAMGTQNVSWLWTANVTDNTALIPNPAPWWPGSSYVTWVGIDGYYHSPSASFAQVFGPTIVDVRALTNDPILISETGAEPSIGQQAKITDLFTGIRTYGLLGFLWFDEDYNGQDWRISPQALVTFRQQAAAYFKPPSPPQLGQPHPSAG
jgi:mannan endo-1,4-beta-mannosidase